MAPDGSAETRIDYVALPQNIGFHRIVSWVADDIDLSVNRCDHRAALCQVEFAVTVRHSRQRRASFRPDLQDLTRNLQAPETLHYLHTAISTPAWSLSPHDSADWLASSTSSALRQIAQPLSLWRRKSHVSDATWELVDRKKFLFKQTRSLKRTLHHTILQACFVAWKMQRGSTPSDAETHCRALLQDLPTWLCLHHRATALAHYELQQLSQQVTQAIQYDDSEYYKHLASVAARTYEVEGLSGLWKHLRSIMPKHCQKQRQPLRDIDNELQLHFASLEAGKDVSHTELRADCLQRNACEQAQQPRKIRLELAELPTLVDVESLCLKQKPRKAPGPDGVPSDLCRHGAVALAPHLHSVLCKSFLHGVEPLSYKGGFLCAIFKGKGSHDDASGYRGILLANTFAKIAHAWSRQRLLPTLKSRRTIGQLGGLPSQQTVTGVQIIRVFNNVAHQKHLSTGVLFIDLRSAFHHMLRELVFTTSNSLLRSTLLTFLDENDFNIDEILHNLDRLSSQHVEDIPPGLRRFLHDVHHHTWFQLRSPHRDPRQCTHTLRGTRPGSPMADIGFNLTC